MKLPRFLAPKRFGRRVLSSRANGRTSNKFGNIPLVNYLPDTLRDRLAPHVRAYAAGSLLELARGLPDAVVHHGRIYGGYDNIENRWPRLGRILKRGLYAAEKTPLSLFGLSHFLVLEKQG